MSALGSAYEDAISQHIELGTQMLPLSSSVTCEPVTDPRQLDAAYWRKNLESPVMFSGAVQALLQAKEPNHVFVEIGPHSALSGPLRQIFANGTSKSLPIYIPTLARNDHDAQSLLLSTVGHVFTAGVPVVLSRVIGPGNPLHDLPRYPWRHGTRYLNEGRASRDWRLRPLPNHELLGSRVVESTDLEPSWRNILRLYDVLWLNEHTLRGEVTFPGAGYIAMAGEAVQQLHPELDGYSLRNVHFKAPFVLDYDQTIEIITNLKPVELADGVSSDWYAFTIAAYDEISWTIHCQGQVRAGHEYPPESKSIQPLPRPLAPKKWYQTVKRSGLEYGPRF